jgi:hypothetical protein
MRITDLMLGDWVYLTKDSRFPMQVESLGPDWCNLDFDGNEGDVFEGDGYICPIPLTPDLLRSNGFVRLEDDYGRFYYYREDVGLFLYDYGEQGIQTHAGKMAVKVKWVHQLQHILRFVGVENFKINE